MTEPTNGSYVTWRELGLKVDPLKQQIDSIAGDVRAIVVQLARDDGHEAASQGFFTSTWRIVTLIATVLTSAIATTVFTLILRSHQ